MRSARILVVAAAGEREELKGLLEDQGYEVTGLAGTAEAVRAMARSVRPDLAVVSIHLDACGEGIELAAGLSRDLDLPVLYAVDEWGGVDLGRALAHTSGFVTRPFRAGDLRAAIGLAFRRHETEARLRGEAEQYRHLFSQNVAGVYRKDSRGVILRCNLSLARIFGFDSPEELEGRSMAELYASQGDRLRFLAELREHGSVANYEMPMRRRDGDSIWVLENAALSGDPEDDGYQVVGTLIDITNRKTVEARLERQAHQDPLTGLANRRALELRAEQAFELTVRRREVGALLFIDLIRFKEINDTLGHRAGDQVLVETAQRLQDALRASDTAARVGGDEFVVLLADVKDAAGARIAGRRIIQRFRSPVEVDGADVKVRVRIGVALFDGRDESLTEIMARAGKVVSDLKDTTESVVAAQVEGRATGP